MTRARFDTLGGEGVTSVYDGFGRLTSSALAMDGTTRTIGHGCNANGARTTLTHPDGATFTYALDGLDRVKSIHDGAATRVTLGYNPRGQRATLGTGIPTGYGYDPVGRLGSLTHDLCATATTHEVA